MYRLGEVDLIFIHQTTDENYNPKIIEKDVRVKCQLLDSFSFNYYQSQTRDVRNSKNVRVAKYHISDIVENDKRYQLEYVLFNSKRYKIVNFLKDRDSTLYSILDCQEVINE